MHKPGSVLENETYKNLWNLEMQTEHLMPAWMLVLVMIKKNKEPLSSSGSCRFVDPRNENQRKRKKTQVLGPHLRAKRDMEHEIKSDT